ncbi:MAG: glycerol-3-phosphate acyltransferase [Gammaproteobacteria bacterium]
MLELGLKVLASYLLGAVNGSLLLGWLKGIDIRTQGSGNAGGTNALRTQGWLFAVLVMGIDVGKGFVAPWLLPGLVIPGVGLDPAVSREWLLLACAGAAVFGHCYPVWFNFHGGKGAATAVGALLAVSPSMLLVAGLFWGGTLVLSGMVGLATMAAAVSLPIVCLLTVGSGPLMLFLVLLAVFVLFTHRSNIRRILRGEENRMEKAMLLRRSR